MIKLETQETAPQAGCLMSIQSVSNSPAVVLSSSDAWKPQEDDFIRDDSKRKQIISFLAEGRTVEVIGAVKESECVEIAGAWKVVGEFKLVADRQRAGVLRPVIVRVVEVWVSPSKCLYRAPGHSEKPAAVMDAAGKINRAA